MKNPKWLIDDNFPNHTPATWLPSYLGT